MHARVTISPKAFKWAAYIFLAFMWCITVQGLARGNARLQIFCYILPPVTISLLWWLSTFKAVTIRGGSLTIHDSANEVRIAMEAVQHVTGHSWGRGFSHITITFNSATMFGRRIRIKTRSLQECARLAGLLQGAVNAHKA